MIGKTVSHHKILERLGGCGMGAVYEAEDTHLKCTVAHKSIYHVSEFSPQELLKFNLNISRSIATPHVYSSPHYPEARHETYL
jgi:eukaryotic-like serine/threonine-protein kinase